MACPLDPPVGTSGVITGSLSLLPRSKIGWRQGEKKAQGHIHGTFLEWALEAFSGYAAVDELYEGPYCVLSAVDNRQDKRGRSEERRVGEEGRSPGVADHLK